MRLKTENLHPSTSYEDSELLRTPDWEYGIGVEMNDPLIITHAKNVKSKDAPLEIVEDITILANTENMLNEK